MMSEFIMHPTVLTMEIRRQPSEIIHFTIRQISQLIYLMNNSSEAQSESIRRVATVWQIVVEITKT